LELVVLVHQIVGNGREHKTQKVDEAFDFVGHDVEIWDY
jgi:hypothetical protein